MIVAACHVATLIWKRAFSLAFHYRKQREARRASAKPLAGYTRNISETGLALFVPSLRLGDHYLNVVGRQLRIMLKLPTGTVRVHATLLRCTRLDGQDGVGGYLLSACISEMNDSEWVELVQYVRTLR